MAVPALPHFAMPPMKAELREKAKAKRAELARRAAGSIGPAIAGNALPLIPAAARASVAAYAPIGDEADPMPLFEMLAARGHATGLPVTPGERAPLLFRRWQPGDALVPARFGLREPPASAPAFEPDMLLVPLLAFDRAGHRLGYGAGYYDRTLRTLRAKKPILAVGIAYAGQEVEALPAEPHDEKLDWIVTEREARKFA